MVPVSQMMRQTLSVKRNLYLVLTVTDSPPEVVEKWVPIAVSNCTTVPMSSQIAVAAIVALVDSVEALVEIPDYWLSHFPGYFLVQKIEHQMRRGTLYYTGPALRHGMLTSMQHLVYPYSHFALLSPVYPVASRPVMFRQQNFY